MNQNDFEEYLDNQSKTERTQAMGRMVKNAFGIEEKVVLPKSYWQYCMWLEDTYGYDLESYFIQCDEERTDWTLSETIMYWLHRDMTERRDKGEPLPDAYELDRTYIYKLTRIAQRQMLVCDGLENGEAQPFVPAAFKSDMREKDAAKSISPQTDHPVCSAIHPK